MTQEDKELLFKDLCARLPYNIKCCIYNFYRDEWEDEVVTINNFPELIDTFTISEIKPYLFPLSSMTEEQKQHISDRWGINEDFDFEIDPNWGEYFVDLCDAVDYINWLNENHFDYRGLIEKSLALDATGLNIY